MVSVMSTVLPASVMFGVPAMRARRETLLPESYVCQQLPNVVDTLTVSIYSPFMDLRFAFELDMIAAVLNRTVSLLLGVLST
jgi:hypothetical protein